MNLLREAEVFSLGEQTVIVRIGRAGEGRFPEAMRALAALAAAVEEEAPPGLVEMVPAGPTLAIHFDPLQTSGEAWRRHIREWTRRLPSPDGDAGRIVEIPVCYGGEFGPDLAEVAQRAGLGVEEAVRLHSGAEYVVGMIGFAPGFPYLHGLPRQLAAPRRAEPRTRVPAGSVAIGGGYAGIYPADLPGGWHVIGRTPVRLFDPEASPPSLLAPGDRVRFVPVDEAGYRRLAQGAAERSADGLGGGTPAAPAGGIAGAGGAGRGFRVRKPGLYTTVQDAGRPGFQRYGVSPGGAMDRHGYRLANRLAGNRADEPALEMTLLGPELEALEDLVIAVCGADMGAMRNGRPLPAGRPVHVKAGDILRFGAARKGCRAYLAVAGGFLVPERLGGRGACPAAGLPGLLGRAIAAGDELPVRGRAEDVPRGEPAGTRPVPWRAAPPVPLPAAGETVPVRVLPGPEFGRLAPHAARLLLEQAYAVGNRSNRMGLRLEGGEPVPVPDAAGMASEAVAWGTVQLPPGGRPIVLAADRQTTGGYPRVLQVIAADLPLLGQLAPGVRLVFRLVDMKEALDALAAAERRMRMAEWAVDAKRSGGP